MNEFDRSLKYFINIEIIMWLCLDENLISTKNPVLYFWPILDLIIPRLVCGIEKAYWISNHHQPMKIKIKIRKDNDPVS